MARTSQEKTLFDALRTAMPGAKIELVERIFKDLQSKTPQEFKNAYGLAKSAWLKSAAGKKVHGFAASLITAIGNKAKATAEAAGRGTKEKPKTKRSLKERKAAKQVAKTEAKAATTATEGAAAVKAAEVQKKLDIAGDVKGYRRYSGSKELIPEAGPARTTFGTAAIAGEKGVAAQPGRLDQIAKLRTKMLDPDTDIRKTPGVSNVATGEDRVRVNKATQTTGAARKTAVNKALNTKANRAAFAEVRQQFIDAGVTPGKDLNKLMSNLKKSPELAAKIGGGVGKGEAAILEGARVANPARAAVGAKGGFLELMGFGGKSADSAAVAQLTKGVGSTTGKLIRGALKAGVIPLLAFEAFTFAPRIARELGGDSEFQAQMDAIDTAGAGFSHEALAAEYEQNQLIAKHKSRLTQEDPMAMQFLAGAMAGGSLPQKLTQNEVMIGGPSSGGFAQDQAGDEIARAFMGL